MSAASHAPRALSLTPNEASVARNNDESAVFAVSGASRGIGLEFCNAILSRSKGRVVALSRSPDASEGLRDLAGRFPGRVQGIAVDVTDEGSIERAAEAIAQEHKHIDMLINCAGILHDADNNRMPERSLRACRADWMQEVYALNALGPVLLTAGLHNLIAGKPAERPRMVANLSARVGSVSDNGLGGWWGYRMSKAALNMATRNMALELGRKNVLAVALHPGTTDTGLSKPFQKNVKPEKLFKTSFTVDCLLKVIECVEADQSGYLYAWDGKHIPF